MLRGPGSSRSALLDIRGPSPGFGAAIRVLHWTRGLVLVALALSRALDLRNRGSIVAFAEEAESKELGEKSNDRRQANPRKAEAALSTGQLPICLSTSPIQMEQTTARLRKTFHYPVDNDSDDGLPEALDEEGIFTYPPLHLALSSHTLCKAERRLTFLQNKRISSAP